jgi:hypothetical protein
VCGVAGGIGEVLLDMQVGLVVTQPVDDVQRFAIVGADDLRVERRSSSSRILSSMSRTWSVKLADRSGRYVASRQ